MSAKLKAEIPEWATTVADMITKEKDWKSWTNNPCSESNVRQISGGVIKSGMHRRLFMKVGAQLLIDVAKKHDKINELIEKIPE